MSAADAPPSDVAAERSVLGAVLIKPAVFVDVRAALATDDFDLPPHREIFEAMKAIEGRRQPIDPVSLAAELTTRGSMKSLEGGADYLTELARSVPVAENVMYYVRLVLTKAAQRNSALEAGKILEEARAGRPSPEELCARFAAAGEKVQRYSPRRWLTLAERARALGTCGPPFPTGFEVFDQATRGGLRAGGLVIIGGAPGSGKTTLAVQLARQFAEDGAAVALLAADEACDRLVVRVGQAWGFDRGRLEVGDASKEELARRLEALPGLAFVDGGDESATVEAVAGHLRRRADAAGTRGVLLVDSVQTAPAFGTHDAKTEMERVGAVVLALKAAARCGLLVVAASELARSSYGPKNPTERINDLAAFKHSGAIEYGADFAVVLRSVAGENGVVDVAIAKNRWGQKGNGRLVLDFGRATFHEVPIPPEAARDLELNSDALFEADKEQVRRALRENPGINGRDALAAKVTGIGKGRVRTAIRALEQADEIVNDGTPKRPRLHLASAVERNPPESPGGLGGNGDIGRMSNPPESPESPGGLAGTGSEPNPPDPPAPFRGAGSAAGSGGGNGENEDRLVLDDLLSDSDRPSEPAPPAASTEDVRKDPWAFCLRLGLIDVSAPKADVVQARCPWCGVEGAFRVRIAGGSLVGHCLNPPPCGKSGNAKAIEAAVFPASQPASPEAQP